MQERLVYASSPTEWGCFDQVKVMTQHQNKLRRWTKTGLLDDGSETINDKDDEINDEEDVSQHGDDATKTADEEQRREGVGYHTGIACFHLSTTGGFYTKSTAGAENEEASWKGKEIPKEREG